MPDAAQVQADKLRRFLSSFTTVVIFVVLVFLSMNALGLASHLEKLAPAEFQILLSILKNRFFR
jgi:hypothetical protein